MTGILGMAIPGSILPMVIGAVAILAVGTGSGAYTAHKIDGTALAESQAQTAQANTALSDYKAATALSIAKANAAALEQTDALQASENALKAQLLQTQKDANAKTSKLQALLASAQPGDTRPIGPIATRYFEQLRSADTTSATPSPGNP